MELLAHRQEMAHDRSAQLTSEETHRLEEPAKRHVVDWAAECTGVDHLKYDGTHHTVEAERQANGHDHLRKPEVRARPCRGKLGVHQAADRYQSKAGGQDQ